MRLIGCLGSLSVCFVLLGCGSSPNRGGSPPKSRQTADAGGDAPIEAAGSDGGVDANSEDRIVDAPSDEQGDHFEASLPDAGFPAFQPDVPQVTNYGGPVLDAPKVIPIFFANDQDQSKVEDFLQQLAASSFWSKATAEYGAGKLSVGSSIVVTDTPPTTTNVQQVESWLKSYLDGTHPAWPAVAKNNIYTIFYPSTTTISDPNFGTSCVNYGGYHFETTSIDGQSIVYAVIARCQAFGPVGPQGFDVITSGLSHELIEASTDPFALSNPAWAVVDMDHMVWNLAPLGEIGDMCAYEPQSYQRLVGTYMVQRPWSNLSARAGHDPCVPVLDAPYFNAMPVFTENVTLQFYGTPIQTRGVSVPLGQSSTIDVKLFSDAPANDWTLQAQDMTSRTGSPTLAFSWDVDHGHNGDVRHLTIKRLANGPNNGTEFAIYSIKDASTWNMWFGFAGN